jgi:hypothetical protein
MVQDASTRFGYESAKIIPFLLSHSYMLISFSFMCMQFGLHFTEQREADEDFFALSNFIIWKFDCAFTYFDCCGIKIILSKLPYVAAILSLLL